MGPVWVWETYQGGEREWIGEKVDGWIDGIGEIIMNNHLVSDKSAERKCMNVEYYRKLNQKPIQGFTKPPLSHTHIFGSKITSNHSIMP